MGLLLNKRAEQKEAEEVQEISDPILSAWLKGELLNKEKIMNIPSVSGCVGRIADTIASTPIKLYKVGEKGKVIEVKDDIRTYLINEETGDSMDGVQFKKAMIRDYYIGKGAYAYIHKEEGKIKSIHYVNEDQIAFQESVDPIYKDYDILVQGKTYKPYEFIRLLRNTKDGAKGISVTDESSIFFNVVYNALKFEENLVATGGNKKGFVTSSKRLGEPAIDALKKAWKKLYSNNTENVVILNDGLGFQEASNTSVEMQLNENKKTNGDEICKIFKLPPSALTGRMTDADEKAAIKYCYNPMYDTFAKAMNRSMLEEEEKTHMFFAFDTTELTRRDIDERYEAYEIALKNGFMQVDEVRTKENLPPLGLNFIKLGLQDVLYDTKTGTIYTPNTDKKTKIEKKEI